MSLDDFGGPTAKRRPSMRGKIMMDVVNGVERVRIWPKKRGRNLPAVTKAQNELFRQYQWATKFWPASFQADVMEAVQGTPLMPRDLMTMIMAGRLCMVVLDGGRKLYPMAAVQDISESLDILGQIPGDVLVRGESWWSPALEPAPNFVLTYQGVGLPAKWAPVASPGGLSTIFHEVLAVDQTTIDITAIPDSYNDLILSIMGRGTQAATAVEINMTFNGDNSGNYDFMRQNRFGVGQAVNATAISLSTLLAASSPADQSNSVEVILPGYAGTVFRKGGNSREGFNLGGGAGNVSWEMTSFYWNNLTPIDQITLALTAGDFATGTTVSLYGRG